MNNYQLSQRIEIAFWVMIIPIMKRWTPVQWLVQISYSCIEAAGPRLILLRALIWAVCGLVMGYGLGYVFMVFFR
jgi:hypothetical protein